MTALIYKAALPTYTSLEDLNANAGESLLLNDAGTAYELEPGQSGASVAPGYAHWRRVGGYDPTTNSIDFDGDLLAASDPPIVEFDDSAPFVAAFGYPVPKILEAGWYSLAYRVQLAGTVVNVGFFPVNESGESPYRAGEPWMPIGGPSSDVAAVLFSNSNQISAVVYFAAGQHLDLFISGNSVGGTTRQDLVIQRVA